MIRESPPILARIVRARRASVERGRQAGRVARLEAEAHSVPACRDFRAALVGEGVALIAECKERSPSAGTLQAPYDPVALARRYVANGAAAISVLTEPDFFGGRLEHLAAVRAAVAAPLLCKDFIIDELQVLEARTAGADAILLIASILDDSTLRHLLASAIAHGLQPLVEVHTEDEVLRALSAGATMIGINNRDLSRMRTEPETTARLRPLIPPDRVVVSESGIRSRADIDRLVALGVNAALVGEALLRAPDLEARVRELAGR